MNKKNWKAFVLGLLFIVFDLAGAAIQTHRQNRKKRQPTSHKASRMWIIIRRRTIFQILIFDFELKTVLLNSGLEMPIIGLGTWTQDDETVENSVYHALKDGYRLIDTANMYGNEEGVGK